MNILLCGGAGYIGSHMAKLLATHDHRVTVFDNLSTGHRQAVRWGDFQQGDLLDKDSLNKVFMAKKIDAVMHFSALSSVPESVLNPSLYYENNVVGTLNLLDVMRKHGVGQFVFSSTASIFGIPEQEFVDENHPQVPINPYGETKLTVEKILRNYATPYGFNSVSLRYFNAAGADQDGDIGESHAPETHLIPNVLKAILGAVNRLKIFGNDYATTDGTCVRDYIHINDLCAAHLQALDYMDTNRGAHGFNLGNGKGFSVLEVIRAAVEVSGEEVEYDFESRRPGDPPILVADSSLARKELGWLPRYTEIEQIIETAWVWHKAQKF